MNLESDSPDWSVIAAWIIREDLSLSRLVLFHIRVTSQNMEHDHYYFLESLLRVMSYNKMSHWLVFERLAIILDNPALKSDEIDTLILESTAILDEVITEFLSLVEQYARANRKIAENTDPENRQTKRLITEFLGSIWELLEVYEFSRFSFASICGQHETLKQINPNPPKWLKALNAAINLCHQLLIRHSASSSEAFCYIYKIRGFIQSLSLESRQFQLDQTEDMKPRNQKNKMKNMSSKPSIFIK